MDKRHPEAVELCFGETSVARYDAGFADPFPLILFPVGGEQVALETEVALARSELVRCGVDHRRAQGVMWILRELCALGELPFVGPHIAWSRLTPRAIVLSRSRRGALGLRAEFPRLDLAAIAALAEQPKEQVTRALRLLELSFALAEHDLESPVRYDLRPLASLSEDPLAFARELSAERPESSALSAAVDGLEAGLWAALAKRTVPAPEAWRTRSGATEGRPWEAVIGVDGWLTEPLQAGEEAAARALGAREERLRALVAGERGLEVAIKAYAVAPAAETGALILDAIEPGAGSPEALQVGAEIIAAVLAAEPELGSEDPLWSVALDWVSVAARREDADARALLEALTPLLWREPESTAMWLPVDEAWVGSQSVGIAEILGQALQHEEADADTWRVRGVVLGGALLEAGASDLALELMARVSDLDVPSADLVIALRERLVQTYGIEWRVARGLAEAPFLLPERRPEDASDEVDLARLLFDGIVGSVYEPGIEDPTLRETFFALRVADALAYLKADPAPGGGRRTLPRRRDASGGPGMGMVILFLVGLAALIGIIGVFLRTL